VVKLRLLSIEMSIQSQVNPRRIYGGQSGTTTDISSSVLFFHSQYHPTSTPHSFIYHQLYKILTLKSFTEWLLKENWFSIISALMFD
jgi:hypothetical protein